MTTINRVEIERTGWGISEHNGGKHLKLLTEDGLLFSVWPSSGRWMIFGRSFKASVAAVVKAHAARRFRMPPETRPGKCRDCGIPVWWVRTWHGKFMPVLASGETHFGCAAYEDRRRREYRGALDRLYGERT